MSHKSNQPPTAETAVIIGAIISIALLFAVKALFSIIISSTPPPLPTPSATPTATVSTTPTQTATASPTNSPTFTATPTPSPTITSSPTATPTPTLDLTKCNAAGCGAEAVLLPTVEWDFNLLLADKAHVRRKCVDCPKNERLSEAEQDMLIAANPATLATLRTIASSQNSYKLAPGIVYIVYNYVHHIVIDLEESGYTLRNIIPPSNYERGTLITPSYCLSPDLLVVTNADYHGLDGSNKTETGRDIFFHLGRATLFQRGGRFDIDVIREKKDYTPTTISWGGGPIFIWAGQYNYNPKDEWFEKDALDYYRNTLWAKMTVALSKDRKYLFLTASYGLTLKEHAENIISLGNKWGITIDKAMRFDGGESSYMAIRLGDYLVPVLNLEEPLIVNCFAVAKN